MVTLVLAVDRDNDLGRKTGIRSPVIGRESNLEAAQQLGLADPEESDTNTMFAAVRIYDQLLKDDVKVEVVTICGDVRVGTRSDMKIANTLDQVIAQTHATRAVLVSDGAEDRELEPIIRSRLRIDSTRQIVVQQSRPIEDTLYTIIHKMEDPKIQRKFILPVALAAFVWGLLALMGKSEIAGGAILLTLGGYMLVKVAGWEDEIRKFYHDLLSGTSERVSLNAYLIAALLLIIGVARGLDAMQEVASSGMLAMVLGFMSIEGVLPMLLTGLLIVELGRTIDTYLQDGSFNPAIVTFFFTVTSLGLIVAGFVEIVNDIFVQGDFISTKVQYVLGGIIWAFIGFLVNDSIRDRQDSSLPGEE
ncbi:uncharacterized protein METZ01_LOCUS59142 [marine metagenome]|uniref:DUF373 family protein n=1 Tax=marine metagenome TaxID=408172 RepID=A0A381SSI0_9ZZZZ